ncbi:MAG: hypothetical protein ACRDQW_07570, partial [Haloechinothrix sp.]
MSAQQPPSQPWDGGQPAQADPGGPQQQDVPFGDAPEPTQVVQPGQNPQASSEGHLGDSPEPTQVVRQGQAPGAESTQLVPPGMQPSAIPYTPPPSAADNPAAMNQQQGFGQPAAFPPPPQQGFGQPGGFPPSPQLGPQSGG